MTRRVFAFALVLALTLTLAACGEKPPVAPIGKPAAPLSESGEWTGEGGCYKLERFMEGEIYGYALLDGKLYYHAREGEDSVLRDESGTELFRGNIDSFTAGPDCLWVCEGLHEGQVARFYLHKLSPTGEILFSLDSTTPASALVCDDEGRLYPEMGIDGAIYGADGTLIKTLDLDGFLGFRRDGAGTVYVSYWDNEMFIVPLDPESLEPGEPVTPPEDRSGAVYTGDEERPFIYENNRGLFSWKPATGETVPIIIWSECGIVPEFTRLAAYEDGFLAIRYGEKYDRGELYLIRPAEPSEIKQKTLLTVASWDPIMQNLSRSVSAFNSKSEAYYVEVVDYSNGTKDLKTAITRLNTELIAGGGPDMILFSGFSPEIYASRGALLDIYELIDADPELKREDFFAIGPLETDGRLYSIAPGFAIVSWYGFEETVGDRYGWSYEEFFALEDSLPADADVLGFTSADMYLSQALITFIPSAIDWEAGTCNFDRPEFIRILEAANSVYDPNSPDENMMFADEAHRLFSSGKLLLQHTWLSRFFDLTQFFDTYAKPLSLIGWPSPDGSCGSYFHYANELGVCAATSNPEGCWEFVKSTLKSDDDVEIGSGFSTLRANFDAGMRELLNPADPWEGMEIVPAESGGFYADGVFVDSTYNPGPPEPKITQAEADEIYGLIDVITVSNHSDMNVVSIVEENAAAMFAGDRTPEETARVIQSRVSIYVSEQS